MRIFLILSLACMFPFHMAFTQSINNSVKIKNEPAKYWYSGVVQHGYLMPVNDGYEADLYGNIYGNQAQPVLISNAGDVIWCDDPIKIHIGQSEVYVEGMGNLPVRYKEAGKTLRDACIFLSDSIFSCTGKIPDEDLFKKPQYNTWIELMYDQNQEDILDYAWNIIRNGFPQGVIMIDDNWQEDYGKWDFHPGRFSDPHMMMTKLHQLGFKVMVWVCPFVSPDSDVYRELERKGLFMKDKEGQPKMVRWWNGVSALLDLSNPEAVNWFKAQLDFLMEEYGVDGFKLDAGDPEYYLDAFGYKDVSPNEHTRYFAEIGLDYPLNEYRANWKTGGQALANRLRDKSHKWEDLQTLVPNMITAGLMGYAYACPDMIGGGEFTSFLPGSTMDQELIVRSAQCHALMPMMQFSVAPWRVLDSVHLEAIKKAVSVRSEFIGYIMEEVHKSKSDCQPILRAMEYEFPHLGYEQVTDQFLIGGDLLVAPVVRKNVNKKSVLIPPGSWMGFDGNEYQGPGEIEVQVDIRTIPFFTKRN